jgi:IS30 family transposase
LIFRRGGDGGYGASRNRRLLLRPHAPWQRGSNENTNGLLRQYFPKGTDLSNRTQAELDAIADELNNRPRKTLGWRKPTEVLNKFLVETGVRSALDTKK